MNSATTALSSTVPSTLRRKAGERRREHGLRIGVLSGLGGGQRAAAVCSALIVLITACSPVSDGSSGGTGSSGSASSPDGSSSGGVCGTSCSSTEACGSGLSCLPSLRGTMKCKPASCPDCPTGKVCAYDPSDCSPVGCTAGACGFSFLDACEDCIQGACCGEWSTCASTSGCAQLLSCLNGCSSSACRTQCRTAAGAAATAAFDAAYSCTSGSCSTACSIGAPPDGGTTSSPVCSPPCLSGQTCTAYLDQTYCVGNVCDHVTCPHVTCTSKAYGTVQDLGATCASLSGTSVTAAACNRALNSRSADLDTCSATPANQMHCDFPGASIDCPAIWILRSAQDPEPA